MKKSKLVLVVLMLLCLLGCETVEKVDDNKVIGVAWKAGLGSKEMDHMIQFLEKSGAEVIILNKTTSSDLAYYEDGTLSDDNLNFDFSLNDECAEIIKRTESIIVDERIDDIDLLIFLGGEDISPSLYTLEYELMDEPIYNPERDVSDYLLARYALDNNIPILGICRGMQLLYVVSGGSLIFDLPTYFEENNIDNLYTHRLENGEKCYHDVTILDKKLSSIIRSGIVSSSHHQAIADDNFENIEILAYKDSIVEAFKLKDRENVLAVQFHPEYYTSEEGEAEGVALISEMLRF